MSHEGNDKIIDNIRDNLDGTLRRLRSIEKGKENTPDWEKLEDSRPYCDPYVNFDHSNCTEEGCEFDEGAYL